VKDGICILGLTTPIKYFLTAFLSFPDIKIGLETDKNDDVNFQGIPLV